MDGVYNVLDTRSIEERQGRFTTEDLDKIWDEPKYSNSQPQLLALMENCQLCFELPGSKTYIAPELLAANPVDHKPIRKAGRLTFIYRYTFMPAGLITRLIVKVHRIIDGKRFWRSGMVVKREGARAVIVEDDTVRQIRIDIEGGDSKRDLLAVVRKEFSDIYADFNRRIEYDELIPCNCEMCRARIEEGSVPHYFNWRTVQRYARKPLPTIRCDESLNDVSVADLMGEISDKPDAWTDDFVGRTRDESTPPLSTQVEPVVPRAETAPRWQIVATGATGIVFVLILLSLAIFFPNPTDFQLFVFRVVLALAAGAFGALIPGFIEVEFRNWLRAGGALALFAIVFFWNPPALVTNGQANSGEPPGVHDSSGTVDDQ